MSEETPSHRMTYGGYLRLDELLELQGRAGGLLASPMQ